MAEKYADAITIHPRTKDQGYSGKPDLEFAELVKQSTKLPVIYSGNVNKKNVKFFLHLLVLPHILEIIEREIVCMWCVGTERVKVCKTLCRKCVRGGASFVPMRTHKKITVFQFAFATLARTRAIC